MSLPRTFICLLPLIVLIVNSAIVAKRAIHVWQISLASLSEDPKRQLVINANRTNDIVAGNSSNSSDGHIREGTSSSNATKEGRSARTSAYSTESIARTVNALMDAPGRLLIYNPLNDTILVYTISNSQQPPPVDYCNACHVIVPMLARALWKNQRLAPNKAPVQIFFSDADFPYVDMQSIGTDSNGTRTEKPESFCSWLQFGSVFRDSTILPTVQAFPFPEYLLCLDEWLLRQHHTTNTSSPDHQHRQTANSSSLDQSCTSWKVPFRHDLSWDGLIPQMIWRGRDYTCLHTFRHEDFRSPYSVEEVPFFPRRQAVNMSANGETWINASIRTQMPRAQISQYKYQIDLAGAGGTTWTGTIEKLAMPGLLFHHETPAKDWYHDQLKPWHHYVPVRTDLADLKERYRWAEENQDDARAIAERGTAFAQSFFSYRNLQKEHERYFGETGVLWKVVDAYENHNSSFDSILTSYQEQWKLELVLVSMCTRQHCDVLKTSLARSRTSMEPGSCLRISRDRKYFGRLMDRCNPRRARLKPAASL